MTIPDERAKFETLPKCYTDEDVMFSWICGKLLTETRILVPILKIVRAVLLGSDEITSEISLAFFEFLEKLGKFLINQYKSDNREAKRRLIFQLTAFIDESGDFGNKFQAVQHKSVNTTGSLTDGQAICKFDQTVVVGNGPKTNKSQGGKCREMESRTARSPEAHRADAQKPPAPPPPPTSLLFKLTNAFGCGKNKIPKTQKVDSLSQADPSKYLRFENLPQPALKLKSVVWTEVPLTKISPQQAEKSRCPPETIWTPVKPTNPEPEGSHNFDLDFSSLDKLFCQISSQNFAEKMQNSLQFSQASFPDGSRKKRESISINLLDSRRSLNVNIFLTSFKHSSQELINLIAFGDSSKIGAEKLELLLKLLPESEEVDTLLRHSSNKTKLGDAEKFLVSLISLDNYKLKIESMLLKEDFDSNANRIKSALRALIAASDEIIKCRKMREILHLVLTIGNYLNSGSTFAHGFKLTALTRTLELKANKSNTLLVHHLITEIERNSKFLLDFPNELVHIEEAVTKDTLEVIAIDLKFLKEKVDRISKQLSVISGEFKAHMITFLNFAKRSLIAIEQELTDAENWRSKLAEYCCEDLATFRMEECLRIFHDFKIHFSKAYNDNIERKLQEAKAVARRKVYDQMCCRTKFDTMSLGAESPSYLSPMLGKQKSALVSQALDSTSESGRNSHCANLPSKNFFKFDSRRIFRRRASFVDTQNFDHKIYDFLNIPQSSQMEISEPQQIACNDKGATSIKSPIFVIENYDRISYLPEQSQKIDKKLSNRNSLSVDTKKVLPHRKFSNPRFYDDNRERFLSGEPEFGKFRKSDENSIDPTQNSESIDKSVQEDWCNISFDSMSGSTVFVDCSDQLDSDQRYRLADKQRTEKLSISTSDPIAGSLDPSLIQLGKLAKQLEEGTPLAAMKTSTAFEPDAHLYFDNSDDILVQHSQQAAGVILSDSKSLDNFGDVTSKTSVRSEKVEKFAAHVESPKNNDFVSDSSDLPSISSTLSSHDRDEGFETSSGRSDKNFAISTNYENDTNLAKCQSGVSTPQKCVRKLSVVDRVLGSKASNKNLTSNEAKLAEKRVNQKLVDVPLNVSRKVDRPELAKVKSRCMSQTAPQKSASFSDPHNRSTISMQSKIDQANNKPKIVSKSSVVQRRVSRVSTLGPPVRPLNSDALSDKSRKVAVKEVNKTFERLKSPIQIISKNGQSKTANEKLKTLASCEKSRILGQNKSLDLKTTQKTSKSKPWR